MKVLILNWVYNWGSTGYIIRDLRDELNHIGIEAIAAAGTTMGASEDNSYIFSTNREITFFRRLIRLGRSVYAGSLFSTYRIIRLINNESPDIVHIHLLHCGTIDLYRLLKWLGQHKIRVVMTHHSESYFTANCGYAFDCTKWITDQCRGCLIPKKATSSYINANPHRNWIKMQKALQYIKSPFIIHTTVSPWLKERLLQSPFVHNSRVQVVLNGIDTTIFNRGNLLSETKFEYSNYCLYCSANFNPTNKNDIKGGYYLVELAKILPDVKFIVVSTNNINCENLPNNIKLWGKAKNQRELGWLYANAEITILTSKKETFSMICAESLCCGTPVVGFKAGGPESISIPDFSSFVNFADLESMSAEVKRFLNISFNRDTISERAISLYSKRIMAKNYLDIYKLLKG